MEKTFAGGPKTSKFAKVFSLKSFPLYGNIYMFWCKHGLAVYHRDSILIDLLTLLSILLLNSLVQTFYLVLVFDSNFMCWMEWAGNNLPCVIHTSSKVPTDAISSIIYTYCTCHRANCPLTLSIQFHKLIACWQTKNINETRALQSTYPARCMTCNDVTTGNIDH